MGLHVFGLFVDKKKKKTKKMFSTAYHDSRLVFKLIRRKLLSYGQLNINIFEYRVELNGNRSTSFFKWSKITILSALPRNKWVAFATHLFIYPNIYLFKYFSIFKENTLFLVTLCISISQSRKPEGTRWNMEQVYIIFMNLNIKK